MNIGDAMAKIAEEAERQGFIVRTTESGIWLFRRNGNLVAVTLPGSAYQLLDVLAVLIFAGLTWPHGWISRED